MQTQVIALVQYRTKHAKGIKQSTTTDDASEAEYHANRVEAEYHARRVRAHQRRFNRATQWLNVYLMLDRRRKQACAKKGKPYTENARIRKRRASVQCHANALEKSQRISNISTLKVECDRKTQRINELSLECRQIKATLTTDNVDVEKVQSALNKLSIEYMELTGSDPKDPPTKATQ